MKEQSTMDVVGLGALNIDMVYEVDNLASLEIERGREKTGSHQEFKGLWKLLKNKGKLRMKSGGGSAANTIYALGRMGFSCGYLGKTGKDEEGAFLQKELKEAGVDTRKIRQNTRSGICLVLLDKSKDRSIIILPNANDTLSYSELDIDYINKAQFLHMSSFVGRIPFEAQKLVATKTKVKISFNPGEPHATKGIKELAPILEHSFILFLSQREAEILTNKDYKKGVKKLLGYGMEIIACTLGKKGSYVLSRDKELEVPADKSEAIDTTGAGDVYTAGFLAGLLKKLPLFECARLATKAAAQSIKGYGRSFYPDRRFLNRISRMVNG
ncbi:hypothetical protein CEE34_00570 [Candidatus Aerophobetes bacterium Ae_b3a]|nr:MAG: hypothetical protein CEE34_00570 [Candidatus Aerophobetes bacterium Ae_b3a]